MLAQSPSNAHAYFPKWVLATRISRMPHRAIRNSLRQSAMALQRALANNSSQAKQLQREGDLP
jgi:hypothetical protein